MKFLRKAFAVGMLAAALSSGAAMADPDPQMYCDCIHRCDKLYPNGGIPHATCVYNCDQAYGPAICKAAPMDPLPADRR